MTWHNRYRKMKDVKLEFDGYWIDVENGWLCIGDDENQVLLKPEYFKKLLAAINYIRCCKSDSEQLHSCKYVKRIGDSCTLNNNCKYPKCE